MDEFGVIGLGRIGGGLAYQALEKGLRVVGASRSGAPEDLVKAGLAEIKDFAGFHGKLDAPRVVFLYVPAGPAVDEILEQLGGARLDLGGTLECWRHGSVIRGWLVELLAQAYAADPQMKKPGTHIEDTGEVNWLVADALRMEVPVPVISQAVMQLFASRDEGREWAKAVVAMRHGFGGHPYGKDEGIAEERREGRVGEIVKPGKSGLEPS